MRIVGWVSTGDLGRQSGQRLQREAAATDHGEIGDRHQSRTSEETADASHLEHLPHSQIDRPTNANGHPLLQGFLQSARFGPGR